MEILPVKCKKQVDFVYYAGDPYVTDTSSLQPVSHQKYMPIISLPIVVHKYAHFPAQNYHFNSGGRCSLKVGTNNYWNFARMT